MRPAATLAPLVALAGSLVLQAPPQLFTTFTIVARDAASGDVGVATCSRVPAAGAVVPWARAGVGAAAIQAWAAPELGRDVMALLAGGTPPHEALQELLQDDLQPERRQIGVVSRTGTAASHTGHEALPYAGAVEEPNLLVIGTMVAGRPTLEAMAAAYRQARGVAGTTLADRLLLALEAGEAAGGDRRGARSAALLTDSLDRDTARGRVVNLRVDDHEKPVEELRRIYEASLERLGYRLLARPEGHDVRELQQLLKQAGFFESELDGVFDDDTVAAVQSFRRAQGMHDPGPGGGAGVVDADLVARLRAWVAKGRRP